MKSLPSHAVVSLLVAVVVLAACAPAAAPATVASGGGATGAAPPPREARVVKFGLPSVALSYMPIYIADERGLFAEQGLRAEIVTMESAVAPVAAMHGEIDFGGSATSAIDVALQGGAVRLVMGLFDANPWTMMARADVRAGPDLRGGVIATGGPSPRAFGVAGVRKLGLDPVGDVNFLHTGGTANSLAALASGQVAAAVVTPPYDAKAQELGYHELLFLGDLLDYPYVALPTSQANIEGRTDLVKDALRALLLALQWWKARPDETQAMIVERFNVSPPEAQAAYGVFSRIMTATGDVKESSIRTYLAETAPESAGLPLETFVDHGPLRAVQAELRPR